MRRDRWYYAWILAMAAATVGFWLLCRCGGCGRVWSGDVGTRAKGMTSDEMGQSSRASSSSGRSTRAETEIVVTTDGQGAMVQVRTDAGRSATTRTATTQATHRRQEASHDVQIEADRAPPSHRAGLVLMIGGGLAVAAGVLVLAWLRMAGLGWGLIAAGAATAGLGVAVDWLADVLRQYGLHLLGALVAAGMLAVVVYLAWRWRRGQVALDVIVPAVADAGATAEGAVRRSVGRHSGRHDAAVRAEVARAKARGATRK